jgi:histidine ammonia-lyase
MGATAARQARAIHDNVTHVIAIELMTAALGLDLRADGPARLGRGTAPVHAAIRRRVAHWDHDRIVYEDIEALTDLIRDRSLVSGRGGASTPQD